MEETRRYIRYVIPGIFFIVEGLILLWLLRPDLVDKIVPELISKNSGLAALGSAVLASGGLGVMFSAIHHTVHWQRGNLMNHSRSIQRLVNARWLIICEGKDLESNVEQFDHRQAWIITTAVWHQLRETNNRIKSAQPRTKELMDHVHSLGTAWIASLVTLVSVFLLLFNNVEAAFYSWTITCPEILLRIVISIILLVGLPCLLFENYRRTANIAQDLIDQILADALREETKEHGPLKTWPSF